MLLRNRSFIIANCLPFIKKFFLRVFVIVCVSVCGCFIFSWKIWLFSMNFCGGSEAVLKNQVSGFNNIKLTDMHFSEIFLFWNLGIYLWPKVSHWSQICSAYEPACIWIWLYLKFYQQNCKYNTHWVTNGKSGTEGILAINNVHWTFF